MSILPPNPHSAHRSASAPTSLHFPEESVIHEDGEISEIEEERSISIVSASASSHFPEESVIHEDEKIPKIEEERSTDVVRDSHPWILLDAPKSPAENTIFVARVKRAIEDVLSAEFSQEFLGKLRSKLGERKIKFEILLAFEAVGGPAYLNYPSTGLLGQNIFTITLVDEGPSPNNSLSGMSVSSIDGSYSANSKADAASSAMSTPKNLIAHMAKDGKLSFFRYGDIPELYILHELGHLYDALSGTESVTLDDFGKYASEICDDLFNKEGLAHILKDNPEFCNELNPPKKDPNGLSKNMQAMESWSELFSKINKALTEKLDRESSPLSNYFQMISTILFPPAVELLNMLHPLHGDGQFLEKLFASPGNSADQRIRNVVGPAMRFAEDMASNPEEGTLKFPPDGGRFLRIGHKAIEISSSADGESSMGSISGSLKLSSATNESSAERPTDPAISAEDTDKVPRKIVFERLREMAGYLFQIAAHAPEVIEAHAPAVIAAKEKHVVTPPPETSFRFLGSEFRIGTSAMDGNCLFDSIAQQVGTNQLDVRTCLSKVDVSSLVDGDPSGNLLAFATANIALGGGEEANAETITRHQNNVTAEDHQWGTLFDAILAAISFQRPVYIFYGNGNDVIAFNKNGEPIDAEDNGGQIPADAILLYNNGNGGNSSGTHWQPLTRIP